MRVRESECLGFCERDTSLFLCVLWQRIEEEMRFFSDPTLLMLLLGRAGRGSWCFRVGRTGDSREGECAACGTRENFSRG